MQNAYANDSKGFCYLCTEIVYENHSQDASDCRKCCLITSDHSRFTNCPLYLFSYFLPLSFHLHVFPSWNSVVYGLLAWLLSELKHWVTQNTSAGGFGEPESSSVTDNLPGDSPGEREFDSQMLLKWQELKFLKLNGEHLVKESLGGVTVQLLNNQLMAPDWKLRSSALEPP